MVGSSLPNCRSRCCCRGLVVACLIVGLVLLEVVGGWQ